MTGPDLGYLLGRTVEAVKVGYDLELLLWREPGTPEETEDASATLSVARFEFHPSTGASVRFDADVLPEEPNTRTMLAPLLALYKSDVADIATDKGGILTVHFSNGASLLALPRESYESWTIDGPGEKLVVCTPGGELAWWE